MTVVSEFEVSNRHRDRRPPRGLRPGAVAPLRPADPVLQAQLQRAGADKHIPPRTLTGVAPPGLEGHMATAATVARAAS